MATLSQPTCSLRTSDGGSFGLSIHRFDERQRRLRLQLPKPATCWDYANLIDVVRHEPGFSAARFTGKTASEWHAELKRRRPSEGLQFKKWYESVSQRYMPLLESRPRTPLNHYCADLAVLPLVSSLRQATCALGLKKASAWHWQQSLRALTEKGIKSEELAESGVLTNLDRLPTGKCLTLEDVLRFIDLSHVVPKLATESQFGFITKAGWHEGCQRIPESEFKRRGLWTGGFGGSLYVIRYRHEALDWSIIRCRHRDLLTHRPDWWWVLDSDGKQVNPLSEGFDTPEEAMSFAEQQMSLRYAPWGKDLALSQWERFSLPGSRQYQEVLLILDDWMGSYWTRHYRARNVLAHIRTGVRETCEGQRVLYLEEVQSDWHADIYAGRKGEPKLERKLPLPAAPFKKEWPLLTMKLMLWWAQRLGVDGLAWSTADLQVARWRGYAIPETLYRSTLPMAAQSLAKALSIPFGKTQLSVRTHSRVVHHGGNGWVVRNRKGSAITKPFRTRDQAEYFADHTGEFITIETPVLWVRDMPRIQSIPLYGMPVNHHWFQSENMPFSLERTSLTSSPKGKAHAER